MFCLSFLSVEKFPGDVLGYLNCFLKGLCLCNKALDVSAGSQIISFRKSFNIKRYVEFFFHIFVSF